MRNARIRARTATRLAWSLWAVCVALIALALLLDFLTDDIISLAPGKTRPWPRRTNGRAVAGVPDGRRADRLAPPHKPYRLDLLWRGLALRSCGASPWRTPTTPCTANFALPWGEYVAWFSTWVGFAGPILAGVFLMLLFPDGRLPSRRWRIVAWTAVLGAALTVLADAFMPELCALTLTSRTRSESWGLSVAGSQPTSSSQPHCPRYDAAVGEQSRCAFLAHASAAPRAGR